MTDRVAPRRAGARHTGANATLARVYERHWAELVRFVRHAFGSGPPDPEDIAQSAFGRLAALPDPAAIENPRAFLFHAARNLVLDQRRRHRVRQRFAQSADAEELTESPLHIDPERALVARQRLAIIAGALKTMAPRQRDCLLLHRLHNLPYADIARRQGISETLARRLVLRAVLQCQEALRRAEEVDTS